MVQLWGYMLTLQLSGSPVSTMKVAEDTIVFASHTVTMAIYIVIMVLTHWFTAVTSRTTSNIA